MCTLLLIYKRPLIRTSADNNICKCRRTQTRNHRPAVWEVWLPGAKSTSKTWGDKQQLPPRHQAQTWSEEKTREQNSRLLLSLTLLSLSLVLLSSHPLESGKSRSILGVLPALLSRLSVLHQTERSVLTVGKCELLPVILTATVWTDASTRVVMGGNGRSADVCILHF